MIFKKHKIEVYVVPAAPHGPFYFKPYIIIYVWLFFCHTQVFNKTGV